MSLRRRRGFTLIEMMIVVAIVGILALLAVVAYRKWVDHAHLAEAQDIVSSIRSAEESFKSENGGYLNVTNGLGKGYDYPAATPGAFATAWGGPCGTCANANAWTGLGVHSNAPVYFGYSVTATNPQTGQPTYNIEADGNVSGRAGEWTIVTAQSGTNVINVLENQP